MAKVQAAGDLSRVTVSVPTSTLDIWRDAAEVEGRSLSFLISDWMTQLAPALAETVRLSRIYRAADAVQRESLRGAVIAAGEVSRQAVEDAWQIVAEGVPSDVQ